jgi:hypothetical protein
MIAKTLLGAAIFLGAVLGAAPAGADSNPCGTHPNPFGSLTSPPHENAPAGAGPSQELDRGLQKALSR